MDHSGAAAIEASNEPESSSADARMRVGTLQYTRAGLVLLFVWLLWGDFCFSLMELVVPSIVPLKLQSLKASNVLVGLVISTIPSAMNFTVCPWVSFASDRYRSRLGRRIPFLLWATPPVALFLILMGHSESLGGWLHQTKLGSSLASSPTAMALGLLALFMVLFQFFNMFIASVYYYLFNDVVPEAYLSRFMSLFRVIGTAAGAAFNFWIYPRALTHTRQIFLIAAVLYLAAFLLMCWRVKEGKYPPPPENLSGRRGVFSSIQTFFVECFTHRFYWDFFLSNTFWAVSFCVASFITFMNLSIGLSLDDLGKINGWAGIASAVLLYPAGVFSDRFHPLRTMLLTLTLLVAAGPANLIWLAIDPTPSMALKFAIAYAAITLPLTVLYKAALFPMYMRLLPKDRYGQFCSADAMLSSLTVMIAGPLAGLFMDGMKWLHNGDPYYYRYAPSWSVAMQLVSLFFLFRVYRYWSRHGGSEGYTPPLAQRHDELISAR
jgi:MFS family permease